MKLIPKHPKARATRRQQHYIPWRGQPTCRFNRHCKILERPHLLDGGWRIEDRGSPSMFTERAILDLRSSILVGGRWSVVGGRAERRRQLRRGRAREQH